MVILQIIFTICFVCFIIMLFKHELLYVVISTLLLIIIRIILITLNNKIKKIKTCKLKN